jgi:membrane protein
VGIMKLITTRLLSFGMIASLGFLLLVSLLATSLIEGLGGRLQQMIPGVGVVVLYIINIVLTLAVTTVLFAAIFKVLPDAKFQWKDIWPGAIATSLLFMVGKFAISLYISKSDIGGTFGSAGSLVILLVWIYYSAIILYFGAEFTKAYAFLKGAKIIPNKYAEWADQPAVAGAEGRSSLRPARAHAGEAPGRFVPASDEPRGHERRATNEGPMYTRSQTKKIRNKETAGMGTVLLGLTLYMLSGNKERRT